MSGFSQKSLLFIFLTTDVRNPIISLVRLMPARSVGTVSNRSHRITSRFEGTGENVAQLSGGACRFPEIFLISSDGEVTHFGLRGSAATAAD